MSIVHGIFLQTMCVDCTFGDDLLYSVLFSFTAYIVKVSLYGGGLFLFCISLHLCIVLQVLVLSCVCVT